MRISCLRPIISQTSLILTISRILCEYEKIQPRNSRFKSIFSLKLFVYVSTKLREQNHRIVVYNFETLYTQETNIH